MLKITNLRYANKAQPNFVLEIFHLSIDKGQIISLCGKNGSRKSTFTDIITGNKHFQQGRIDLTFETNSSADCFFQQPSNTLTLRKLN